MKIIVNNTRVFHAGCIVQPVTQYLRWRQSSVKREGKLGLKNVLPNFTKTFQIVLSIFADICWF